MVIYKYRTAALAKRILADPSIKASKASEFNDPFELAPTIDPNSFTTKDIRTMLLRDHIIQRFFIQETGGRGSFESYARRYRQRKNLSTRVMKYLKRRDANAEFLRAQFAEIFDSHHRIFCASKTKESILMWSYYAEEHKGVVVGFDLEKKPFNELKDWIVTINYQEPKSQFMYNPNDDTWHKDLLRVVGTKYKDWKHEEEVRAVFPGDEEIVNIPEAAICDVIFGCRCTASDRTEIRHILNAPRYSHVQISEARMCRDRFALEFRTLNVGK